ncbi:hypothetical protein M514_26915 [Trichuris suis]|nr:hypothetical protein M514_26915 [Trichuris suis]
MKSLTRYRNAVNRLNGDSSNISRGRPPTLDPRDAMEQAHPEVGSSTACNAVHGPTACEGAVQRKAIYD